jgi:hypothetical protein
MSKFVLTNAAIIVNSVDLSNHCSQVEVSMEKEEVDVTSFGSSAKEILPGVADASITATFFNDFAAASVDATLQPLYQSGSQFPVKVIPNGTVVSATNPSYLGTMVLLQYTPISGGMGDASTMDVEFRNAAQAGIVRGTV